jgi:hypothetical protein
MPRPKSRAQAGFYGLIASGAITRPGFTKTAARNDLRGAKVKGLPKHKTKKR